jgi:hypothetical protein
LERVTFTNFVILQDLTPYIIILSNLSFSEKKDISFLIDLLKVTVKKLSNSNLIGGNPALET